MDILLQIENSGQIREARRATMKLADTIGFSSVDRIVLAVVVSELARNMLMHAGGGEIIIKGRAGGMTVSARDGGPGIADPAQAFRPGHGLFAIRQGMDQLKIAQRTHGSGTCITATKRLRRNPAPTRPSATR